MRKVKLFAASLLIAGMFTTTASSVAGTTSMGERNLPYVTQTYYKTTDEPRSTLTLGDVTIYDCILAATYSEVPGSYPFPQSNPWTTCYENQQTYMGQYVSINAYVGQKIYLHAKPIANASSVYNANFVEWDYK